MSEQKRCSWAANGDAVMLAYHDDEWCKPSYEDTYLFELLNLEGAQAGLSWRTILNKRAGYQEAFLQFDIDACAKLTDEELADIVSNAAIIRNKAKVNAVRTNAQATQKVQAEFGSFSKYMWHFTDDKVMNHQLSENQEMPAKDELSERVSKDMKKRGFKFVGPVIVYSYLQAIGVINDHAVTCAYNQQ
ncbi:MULTISPECIES: DNA-3-methyladenine glycosylase I [Listeria]|uniref:DNA-3-methyladenine glycosylase I n=1 Tax=Listeria TaxID=1637 RepID=UPI000B58D155|nr:MULTISPECIES: DNA-3-methyladenine glycosylase I [Listeria]